MALVILLLPGAPVTAPVMGGNGMSEATAPTASSFEVTGGIDAADVRGAADGFEAAGGGALAVLVGVRAATSSTLHCAVQAAFHDARLVGS